MHQFRRLKHKIVDWDRAAAACQGHIRQGDRVVFTNGCFDILHAGHVNLLEDARLLGDVLVVGLNSDASVRGLKGPQRPINPEWQRAEVLAALAAVDYVVLFAEPDPLALITRLQPRILVKGGDWTPAQIVGREIVEAGGGRVVSLPLRYGASTTDVIERVLQGGS